MKQRTDLYFRKAAPRDKRYELPDRDGLVLEVQPSGKRTWRYRYRLNGRREKVSLGPYPTISLEEARDLRREAERLVVAGKSPASEKQAKLREQKAGVERSFGTVKDLADNWVDTKLKTVNKNSCQDETYLQRDILPVIGKRDPQSITPRDIFMCVEPVRLGGHGQAARRVLSVLRRVFEFARGAGIVQSNPATILRPTDVAPTSSRLRALEDHELRQLDDAIGLSRLSTPMRLAFRLLMLVPARKGELIKARWEDIDLERSIWTIPEQNAKKKKALEQKLPPQAMKILRELKTAAGDAEWVIPSTRGRGRNHLSLSALNVALKTIKGRPVGMVIHDLRRTIRTGLGNMEVQEVVAELCLNHRKGGVGGTYDRAERLEPRYEALCRWADRVDRALGRTNVTPFRVPRQSPRSAEAKV